jgi:lipoprotein-releasing system ATP-binding protein
MNDQLSFENIETTIVTPDSPVVIRTANLVKSYFQDDQELKVLKGLDLEFRRGEFTAIIGPSGAGKSTLLHLLGLLDLPTTGQVIFEDTDAAMLTEGKLARLRDQRIGFIFQFYHLLPEFTVLENVLMPFFIRENTLKLDDGFHAKAEEILDKVNLRERSRHYPSQLSGGEQQRVAIARAIIADPDVVLADEPTGNLDYKASLEIMRLLQRIHEVEGKTVIMVTHNDEYAKKAQRVIKLKDGHVI